MKRLLLILFYLVLANPAFLKAQQQDGSAVPKDTATLQNFLKRGRVYGQARSYISATVNQAALSDYAAWGVGAGMGYESPLFLKRLRAGMGGYAIFNLASLHLTRPDPTTGQPNRYEIGLFDVENPGERTDLLRLEELFAKVLLGRKSLLTVGRQIPQSPFINAQDGRMRPTLIEGAVLDWKEWKHLSLYAAYIHRISPRSTVRWYRVDDSMGLYPVGVGPDGKPAQYKGQVQSGGIGMVAATYQASHWRLELWNTYVDRVFNTLLLKTEWTSAPQAQTSWLAGLQVIRQQVVGNGGSADPAHAYAPPGHRATVVSARLGQKTPSFDWLLNATRITAEGRFLMPREWGREPFYTFLPRERNEGAGNVTAATLNLFFKPVKGLRLEGSGGVFVLPDVKKYALNKYGQPAYTQVNLGATYQFGGYLKGLNAVVLVVRKDRLGETYGNKRFVLNKVNMTHANLILTYQF